MSLPNSGDNHHIFMNIEGHYIPHEDCRIVMNRTAAVKMIEHLSKALYKEDKSEFTFGFVPKGVGLGGRMEPGVEETVTPSDGENYSLHVTVSDNSEDFFEPNYVGFYT